MVRLREHLSVTAYGLGSDIHVARDVSRDVTREFLSPGSLSPPSTTQLSLKARPMANGRPGSDTAARCSPIGGPDLAILGFLLYNLCYFVFLMTTTPVKVQHRNLVYNF